MKSIATIIVPIFRVTIGEALGRGDKLDEHLWLTNDATLIRSRMSARLVHQIGILERDATCNAGLVAYGEFTDDLYPQAPAEAEELIAAQLFKIQYLIQILWCVKDNAASVENGFLDSPDIVSSRIWAMQCTMADGSDSNTEFTRDELRKARTLYRNFMGDKWGSNDIAPIIAREVIARDCQPLARAVFFVGVARSSHQLSVKIANYCSALESLLLAASTTELNYRLCQRVAWLLGDSPERRYELFQRLKDAYDFRSKAVHGSYTTPNKLANELMPAVQTCDNIVRAIFWQIGEDEVLREYLLGQTNKPEKFEDRLLRITLGADVAPSPKS